MKSTRLENGINCFLVDINRIQSWLSTFVVLYYRGYSFTYLLVVVVIVAALRCSQQTQSISHLAFATMEITNSSCPVFYVSRLVGYAPYQIYRNKAGTIVRIRLSKSLGIYSVGFVLLLGKKWKTAHGIGVDLSGQREVLGCCMHFECIAFEEERFKWKSQQDLQRWMFCNVLHRIRIRKFLRVYVVSSR